jgi:hypothetical protein
MISFKVTVRITTGLIKVVFRNSLTQNYYKDNFSYQLVRGLKLMSAPINSMA